MSVVFYVGFEHDVSLSHGTFNNAVILDGHVDIGHRLE